MNQKPLMIQGGMMPLHHNTYDQYSDIRNQYQQQKHQNQQQQQPQHHNYQLGRPAPPPPTSYSSTPNPSHRSYWTQPSQGNAPSSTTSVPIPVHSGTLELPAPNISPSHQNQNALQQLKNNLRLVLNQPQQHPTKRIQQQHQSQGFRAQGMTLIPLVKQCQNGVAERHGEGPRNSEAPPLVFQNNTLSHNPISSSDPTAPSLTEERISINTIDAPSMINNETTRRERRYEPTQQSFSSQMPSGSISSGLFALGDEFQPLPNSQQKESSPPLSSDAFLVNWSDEATSEEVVNDVFMNNIFHAELKMSRQNKRTDKDSKLKPSYTHSESSQQRQVNPCSKIDESLEQNVVSQNQETTKVANQKNFESQPNYYSAKFLGENSNASTGTTESISSKPLKDKPKKSRKNKSKQTLSPSRTKQKRKLWLKRKPKFPVLEKDPPIEEQILSLPAVALAPSLLASLVADDPRYTSTGVSNMPNPTINMNIRKRKRIATSCPVKYNIDDDDDFPPCQTFHNILKARGHNEKYSTETEGTEYDVVPSPLQLASYGGYLVWATQSSDCSLVRKLLGCGLSPNPCNQFRDSILGDLVCKKGNFPLYKCFVNDFNADLQVVDGFGRTLLHHCCWAHELCRPIVENILQRDPIQIFLKDKQEKTPLEYVRADAFGDWNRFLEEVADKYWPKGSKLPQLSAPFSGKREPNGDLQDPPEALTPALATGVASGNITPEAALTTSELSRKKKGKQ